MAILTMPATPRFAAGSAFGLTPNSLIHESLLDRTQQTLEFPGARWTADYVLPLLTEAEGVLWSAFLAELDGHVGRFYGWHPFHIAPRGTAKDTPGTPLVQGAAQTGKTVDFDGAPINETGYLLIGDHLGIDLPSGARSLHKVVAADVDSDGGGAATATIRPPLRESPADDAAIHLSPASCTMKLLGDDQMRDQIDTVGHYQTSFAAEEAFNV